MTKEELKHLLVKTEEYTREQVDNMSGYELLDAMLTWEGIAVTPAKFSGGQKPLTNPTNSSTQNKSF